MHYFKLQDIKFNRDSEAGDSESGEAAGGSFTGFAVENQNLRETEGSDANKIEAGSK